MFARVSHVFGAPQGGQKRYGIGSSGTGAVDGWEPPRVCREERILCWRSQCSAKPARHLSSSPSSEIYLYYFKCLCLCGFVLVETGAHGAEAQGPPALLQTVGCLTSALGVKLRFSGKAVWP